MIYVLLLVFVGLLLTPMLLHMLSHRRLDRRYEELDIRLVGGPFHGSVPTGGTLMMCGRRLGRSRVIDTQSWNRALWQLRLVGW